MTTLSIKNIKKERELNAIAMGFTLIKDTTFLLPRFYNTGFKTIDLAQCGVEKKDIMDFVSKTSRQLKTA